jgi:hypothetical protein
MQIVKVGKRCCMDKILTPQNIFKGFAIAININILSFIVSVIISIGWTYILAGFWSWDWEYLLYLSLFYGMNILLTLLIKKWYYNYLQGKNPTQIN